MVTRSDAARNSPTPGASSGTVWLNTPKAAAYLGLSGSTLAKMRVYGGGPPFGKFGSAVRYKLADLDDWTASKLAANTSAARDAR